MSHEAEEAGARPVYESMAAEYAAELDRNPWNSLYERPGMVALLPPVAGKQVLDVGCGPGSLSAWLARNGARVTGFDASAAMVELAEKRAIPSASFVVADLAEPLDFLADDTFDIAVAGLVLHYLRDWVAPLRELRRVLRPDGTIVFSTHHPESDVHLAESGNYFATEQIHDRLTKGCRNIDDTFWAIEEAGFRVERLSEPQPLEQCRDRYPEAWARLTTEPHFVFFRLTSRSSQPT